MRLFIIAGEASGDLHGAALMQAILELDSKTQFQYWGGDEMQKVQGHPQKHIRDLAFMGFAEVIKHLPTIMNNFKQVKEHITDFQPDALILIDYPGFNIRMAKWAHQKGIKVIYYISPQLWAWKESRVKAIRQYVDQMLVILPFEKSFYAKHNIDVDYVGHPLAERLINLKKQTSFLKNNGLDDRPIVAILPGSRRQEIQTMLPVMLDACRSNKYQYIVAGAPAQTVQFYKKNLQNFPNIKLLQGQTYQLLLHAKAALVTSGTATLETALLRVPQVVCYKGSWLSYQIARRLIKVKYISLVNLILDHPVVPEMIQSDMNADRLDMELQSILNGAARDEMLHGYDVLIEKLAGVQASSTAAKLILNGLMK